MQKILILDFGGQYNQLIARRVRENQVYCEVHPWSMPLEEIRAFHPIGIIFTGGPNSVYLPDAPKPDPGVFAMGVPILGICYGCQLLAQMLGGRVEAAELEASGEFGRTLTRFDPSCTLFYGLPEESVTWMSHGDHIAVLPSGFRVCARSDGCPTAGICDESRRFYGVQFHPEVRHTVQGKALLRTSAACAAPPATGPWRITGKRPSPLSARRSATAAFFWGSPAGWIPLSPRRCWPRPWGTASPACTSITA